MIDTISPDSFYNAGGHYLFFLLITAHVCLFVDISPLQKKSMCGLNYLLATLLSAAVPSIGMSLIVFSTPTKQLTVGISSAVVLSVLITLTIQRVFDMEIDF